MIRVESKAWRGPELEIPAPGVQAENETNRNTKDVQEMDQDVNVIILE